MFGSPIRTTIIIGLLFLCGGLLGFSLIGTRSTKPVAEESEATGNTAELVSSSLTIRGAHSFQSISCLLGGKEIELDTLSSNEVEAELQSNSTLEFTLKIDWPENTPETAVIIQVMPDGKATLERTIWAEGTLTEELTFFL